MSLTAKLSGHFVANFVQAIGLHSSRSDLDRKVDVSFTDGAGALQVSKFSPPTEFSIASGASLDIDFAAGNLLDALNQALGLTKLKGLLLEADPANTTDLTIGPKTGNALPFLTGTTPAFKLTPGGIFLLVDPSAAGIAVTGGSTDQITVVNGSGATAKLRITAVGA